MDSDRERSRAQSAREAQTMALVALAPDGDPNDFVPEFEDMCSAYFYDLPVWNFLHIRDRLRLRQTNMFFNSDSYCNEYCMKSAREQAWDETRVVRWILSHSDRASLRATNRYYRDIIPTLHPGAKEIFARQRQLAHDNPEHTILITLLDNMLESLAQALSDYAFERAESFVPGFGLF